MNSFPCPNSGIRRERQIMLMVRCDDYLYFDSMGEPMLCSCESVAIELMGESANEVDRVLIKAISKAIARYFNEKGQDTVTVNEFSQALSVMLNEYGYSVAQPDEADVKSSVRPKARQRRWGCRNRKWGKLSVSPPENHTIELCM